MSRSLAVDVVEAVAEAEGVEPTDLDYRLEHHIDTDCLDRLRAIDGTAWTFSFELPDHTVTVSSDGSVAVDADRTELCGPM